MIRRPPRSTLFPYTRSSDLWPISAFRRAYSDGSSSTGNQRSEEHTSELQSRSDLVCRLLLEKKKHQHRRCPKGRGSQAFRGRRQRREAQGDRHSSFFFNDTATTEIYTLSLHDALPI